jgi:hypothetical protein
MNPNPAHIVSDNANGFDPKNEVLNSDPNNMVPRAIPKDSVHSGKPSIDSIKRGQEAEGYLKELCEYYQNDRIAPGLQSAWLPDKTEFYVSIHRFPSGRIDSRTIIAKATAATLADAEAQCMSIWRSIAKQVEEERRLVIASSD